jgi:hypothetical protein
MRIKMYSAVKYRIKKKGKDIKLRLKNVIR